MLLELLTEDGFRTKKVAMTKGGEFSSPCPWCGGEDRFRTWPAQGETGRYWCRQCDRKGDAIQYLRDYRNLDFREACTVSGADNKLAHNQSRQNRSNNNAWPSIPEWTPTVAALLPRSWSETTQRLVAYAVGQLWDTDHGANALAWLKDERLLNEETIRMARLGMLPRTYYRSRRSFGLPPESHPETGRPKMVWIPSGIVIPCISNSAIVRVRIRRFADGGSRYVVLSGSGSTPMTLGCDAKLPIILVESELDALLLNQEAGDLVGVVALGSVSIRPDQATDRILRAAPAVLVAFDGDDAGAKQVWNWWHQYYPEASRALLPHRYGKDPCEAAKNGCNLRNWVQVCLQLAGTTILHRLHIL